MLRLNLLGGVNLLDSDGAPVDLRLGPRPIALLLFLLLEGRQRAVRRDRAVALLWAESDQSKARASLNQALYDLRKALGDDVIWSRGKDQIGIDVAHVTCDCFEFRELAATGALEECVTLYQGDFAAGLYAREAHAFEEWLEQQREYWRAAYAGVLSRLYEGALGYDDLVKAAHWAERMIEVAPASDAPVRTLLPLLIERGQTGAAVRLFDVYAHKVRSYLEVDPAEDLTTLIAGVRQAQDARHAAKPLYIASPKWRPRKRVSATVGAAGFVIIALTASMFMPWQPSTAGKADTSYLTNVAAPAIVVLPLQHPADQLSSRTSVVLGEALQWRLRDSGFRVLSGEGVSDVAEVARGLRTSEPASPAFIVSGELTSYADGAVTTTLQIRDAYTSKVLWTEEFTERAADLHKVGTQLSDAVAAAIRRAVGHLVEISPAGVRPSAEHWRAVYRAREHLEGAREMRVAGAVSGATTELQMADSILAAMAEAEPEWPLPVVLRSRVAEARAQLSWLAQKGDARQGAAELERGIAILDAGIRSHPSAELFERRGLAKFRRWAYGVEDTVAARILLASAESDLRRALDGAIERSISSATLSGVKFAQGKFAEAYVLAGRAYETNLFLRENAEILTRLFNSAFHAADDRSADHWCREIRRVLVQQWPAVLCRIDLAAMSKDADMSGIETEIAGMAASPAERALMQPRLLAAYANMLAHRGMADSARVVLRHTRAREAHDPELLVLNAFALRALGRIEESQALIEQYLATNRGTRSSILDRRWLN